MRLHISGGEQKTITTPIILKGVLVDTDGINSAELSIIDSNGSVTPVGGLHISGASNYGGLVQLNEACEPTITIELVGTGSSATIYYEEIQWKDVLKLLRVFSY